MMQNYTVKLDAFEGPMDLLMHLIEKNKIDIYDIPMAELTEQYMEYLARFKEFNIEIASEFIVMAATLLQIKSRMMLPKPPKESAEDEDEVDPRQELVARILEYRRFKQVSSVLDAMAEQQGRFFSRDPLALPIHHCPPDNIPLKALLDAFRTALEVHEELTIPETLVAPETYSIQGKMEDILLLLDHAGGKILFSEAFRSGTREELIMTFLALLELIKLKSVVIRQQRLFAEIYICMREGGTGCS